MLFMSNLIRDFAYACCLAYLSGKRAQKVPQALGAVGGGVRARSRCVFSARKTWLRGAGFVILDAYRAAGRIYVPIINVDQTRSLDGRTNWRGAETMRTAIGQLALLSGVFFLSACGSPPRHDGWSAKDDIARTAVRDCDDDTATQMRLHGYPTNPLPETPQAAYRKTVMEQCMRRKGYEVDD
jgi:hypothetical protein